MWDEFEEIGKNREYVYPATNDPDVPLETMPHYSDDRFRREQTVYGRAEKGLVYNYSDRIWQWDYKKAEEATEIANKSKFKLRSARWYEVYLSAFFGKPIQIKHILAGVNVSNGYPYCVFGYKDA